MKRKGIAGFESWSGSQDLFKLKNKTSPSLHLWPKTFPNGSRSRARRQAADIEYGGERPRAEVVGHQAAFGHGHPCRVCVAQSAGCGARPPKQAPGPPREAALTKFA